MGKVTRVTPVMNDALLTPFKREEIWVALKSMASLKAPGPGNGRIEGHTIDIRYTKVSDLIDPIQNEWNTRILRSLFEFSLVDRILRIPLTRSKPPDSLVWRCERSGQYSPKSGYRLLIDEELQPHSGNTNDQNILYSVFFKALWQIHVPSKCKIFLWRLFHNYVPPFDNLQQRRINVRNICPFCAEAAESNVHFVRECSFTRNLFDLLHIHVPDVSQHQDYKALLASFLTCSDSKCRVSLQSMVVVPYWSL
ncbi:hypothetical protein V6N11_031935 [Hibiscus sabdariffa]|uniref:Reverse transcriptase zinc-binding domain-containing protein n=1 Tax=Hibiscus sabdariffa TaxID=183260 RepID=A0ABR2SZB0_9ROSI